MIIEIPDNLKEKLTKYVDGSMSKVDIKKIVYQANISIREATMIHAFQIDTAISKLKGKGFPKYITEELQRKEYWIKSWQKFYSNVSKTLEHLKNVCKHISSKYGDDKNIYEFAWLLDFDVFYYNAIIKKYKKGRRGKVDMNEFEEIND